MERFKIKCCGFHQNVPKVSQNYLEYTFKLRLQFYVAVKYSLQIGSVLLYQKWQILNILVAKYEGGFHHSFTVVIGDDLYINLLKEFSPHVNYCYLTLLS